MNENTTNLEVFPYAKDMAGIIVTRPGMQVLVVLTRKDATDLATHLDEQLAIAEADDFEPEERTA